MHMFMLRNALIGPQKTPGRTASPWLAAWLMMTAVGPTLAADGPDLIVGGVAISGFSGSNQNDIIRWGAFDGITAYSFGDTACNIGTVPLLWSDDPPFPAFGQNVFRLKDGRFEQLGQAWAAMNLCPADGSVCGPCQPTPHCDGLGVGCSDPATAPRNGTAPLLRPKSEVNAATGEFPPYPQSSPTGNSTIRGRLQVHTVDVTPSANAGALYFLEGQYVAQDDAAAGNQDNNASWRQVVVESDLSLTATGFSTHQKEPGILAWSANDPAVRLNKITVENDGRFWVGCKVTDLGGGMWHYEYAIQNLNSDRSGQSFSIPIPAGVNVTNIGFHDVDYHSGDGIGGVNRDGTDWPGMVSGGNLTWATIGFSTNQNANALRWGTLYNFRFDADAPPAGGTATLGLFKPGIPASKTMTVQVPMVCDCLGDLDGSTTVDGDDIQLFVDMAVGGTPVDPCAEVAVPDGVPLDTDDVNAMVTLLLNGTPCP